MCVVKKEKQKEYRQIVGENVNQKQRKKDKCGKAKMNQGKTIQWFNELVLISRIVNQN